MTKPIMNLTRDNADELMKSLALLKRRLTEQREKTKSSHPIWNEYEDARIWIFQDMSIHIQNTRLSMLFLKHQLLSDDWWDEMKEIYPNKPNPEQKKQINIQYSMELKTNLMNNLFICVETFLRCCVRDIPSSKYPKGTENIGLIREYLIATVARISSDYNNLIEIYQRIRNTVHNSGFHFNKDEVISYKGKIFSFTSKTPVDMTTWPFFIWLYNELIEFLDTFIDSAAIKAIPEIKHPFATIEFER